MDFSAPWARILVWAGVPLGLELELVPPDHDDTEYDRAFRFGPRAFEGSERAHPGTRAITIGADLLLQKRLFRALGLPTPPFGRVANPAEWEALARVHGLPAWLRPRRGGRGERVEAREVELLPEAGGWLYERALPFEAELLLLAVAREGEARCWPAARWREGAWVLAGDALGALFARACRGAREVLLALGHEGGLELRLGLLAGEVYFLDLAPFPTWRSLFAPEFAEAHLRAALGHEPAEPRTRGPVAVLPTDERAFSAPFASPFVLDRTYARVHAEGEKELLERLLALG